MGLPKSIAKLKADELVARLRAAPTVERESEPAPASDQETTTDLALDQKPEEVQAPAQSS